MWISDTHAKYVMPYIFGANILNYTKRRKFAAYFHAFCGLSVSDSYLLTVPL